MIWLILCLSGLVTIFAPPTMWAAVADMYMLTWRSAASTVISAAMVFGWHKSHLSHDSALAYAIGAAFGLLISGAIWALDNYCVADIYTKLPRWRKTCPYILLVGGVICALVACDTARAQTVTVPDVDARMRLQVEQTVADIWGVDASPARLAAQLHQESSWNPHARSSVGAEGLAQIMPATGQWLAKQFPEVGTYDPWDAAWSMRAAAVYDHWLLTRNPAIGQCSNWAFAFSSYNGGETLLHREQALAAQHGRDGKRWFGNTEYYSARSQASWKQNRDYVRRILMVLEPSYVKAGWSGEAVCV